MRILIDCGHTLNGADTGASGCGYREEVLSREVGTQLKSILEEKGHTVYIVSCDSANTLNESLSYRTNKANSLGGDIYVSIHLNAFNGSAHGTEVYTYGGKQLAEALTTLKNIENMGYFNRGVKDGSKLYVLRHTSMKSMLVECCFIDNPNDMSRFNSFNFAKAIAEGIVGSEINVDSPITPPSPPQATSKPFEYGITTASVLNVRNAINGEIIGTLSKGSKVHIDYVQDGWASIFYGEHGGWISMEYVEEYHNSSNSSNWVARLQEECNNQGFSNQTVDGIVGQNTLNGCPLMRKGASGNITKLLQEKLVELGYSTNGIDGIFGSGTENAVRQFQASNGLSVDGVVGKNTWRKLLGL